MKENVIVPVAVEGTGTVNQEGDITMYTFRKLNSTDMFLMFKIIGKIGVNEFTACFEKDAVKDMIAKAVSGEPNDKAITVVGISVIMEMANVILGNLPNCESEIYQMLSNTSNLTVEQIKELDIATFTNMVVDFIKKEEFKDFIKAVSALFKSVK